MAHDGNNGFATWFIFGALVGVAAGMILAPKSGKETREMIGDQTRNWRDKANYQAGRVRERASEQAGRVRERASEQAGRIRERASEQAGRFRERMNDQETGQH